MGADARRRRRNGGWALRASLLGLATVVLAACAGGPRPLENGVAGAPTSRYTGYKVGQPYQVKGVWYYPKDQPSYDEIGIASWYGEQFHNHYTADGEIFDMGMASAAHKTLPLPSLVEVTNLTNGRKVIVRVNDRGPFVDGRVIDMSKAAAEELGFVAAGVTRVRVRYVGKAPAPPETRQYQASNSQQPSLPKANFKLPKPPIQLPQVASLFAPPPLVAPVVLPSVPLPPMIAPPVVAPPIATPPVVTASVVKAAAPPITVQTAPSDVGAQSMAPTTGGSGLTDAGLASGAAVGATVAGATGTGIVGGTVTQAALSPLVAQGQPSYVAAAAASAATGAPLDDVAALLSSAAPAMQAAAGPPVVSYELQAGVFASHANAEALAARLGDLGAAQVEPLQRAGQTLYRVVVHGFSNPAAAAAARSQAATLGVPDARVVAGS